MLRANMMVDFVGKFEKLHIWAGVRSDFFTSFGAIDDDDNDNDTKSLGNCAFVLMCTSGFSA